MTRDHVKDYFECQTCLCCMCRCGNHKCLRQQALKLPSSMQNDLELDFSKLRRNDKKKDRPQKADLYQKTIYKRDFCEQPDIIDRFPLEHKVAAGNLKLNSTHGYPVKDSLYKDDFIPWSLEQQKLCRSKLHLPDPAPDDYAPADGSGDALRKSTYYNYYCPPHCLRDWKEPAEENCLFGHEDRFNIGPHSKKTTTLPEISRHPFAKYSSYMLDYRGSKIPPKKKYPPRRSDIINIDKTQYPVSSETSYRKAFSCPPELPKKATKRGNRQGPADSLKFGDGPMVERTTSMLDYQDPDVGVHKPVRPPKDVYQPPSCRMETTTTTGTTYKKWKDFPSQVQPRKQTEESPYRQHETDIRRLVTTYQEDFDGLKSALCPCRVVEKYGPKVLEPRYNYIETDKPHDIFHFRSRGVDLRNKVCPHA